MKRSRFTEEQIIGVLKESEAGVKTTELLRKHGISEHRLKVIEDENGRLKHLVADLTLDNKALKAVVGKKW